MFIRRLLALVIALTALLLPHASQLYSTAYWQQLFAAAPARFAYSASYYGVGEASHYLGEGYWRAEQRALALNFYRLAVEQGDAGAAYALSQHVPARSDEWLRAAAELGDREASLIVASTLADTDPQRAYALVKSIDAGHRRQELLALLLLRNPELSLTESWRDVAPHTEKWQLRRRGAAILRRESELDCAVPVHIHHTTPRAAEASLEWIARLEQHPLAELDMCFAVGSTAPADCEPQQGRAHCPQADTIAQQAGFHWFVTQGGRANARPQRLFVPVDASFDVIVHELGHWFGLADEYAMTAELAKLFCAGRYNFAAKNIAVTDSTLVNADTYRQLQQQLPWANELQQPIGIAIGGDRYRLGSNDPEYIGLFPAATCEGTGYFAWRPVAKTTFMEQHESGVIPDLYLRLMRQGGN